MAMIGMFSKQRAPAARDRRAKSHLSGDIRFPLSASPLVAERISKVINRFARDLLEKSSVFRDFPPGCRGGCSCMVAVSYSVTADRHQRMSGEFAKLVLIERFAIDQRSAINPVLRNHFTQMRQKATVLVNEALKSLKRLLFVGETSAFYAQLRCQLDAVLRADEGGQPEPPGVDLAGDHTGRDVNGERGAKPFHDGQRAGQIVSITIIQGEASKRSKVTVLQSPNGFIQIDKVNILST